MPAPLSNDLRQRIIAAYQRGTTSVSALASRFEVGSVTVWRLITRYKESGSYEPKAHGGGMPARIGINEVDRLVAIVGDKPDGTIVEYAAIYRKRHKAKCSNASMCRALKRFGLTSKKNALSFRTTKARCSAFSP